MKKLKNFLLGFTLVEMLVVMAIFVVFSAMGAGAFAGIRETVTVRQNVESLKQDIQLAKQKAMLLEREPDENWLYGIGIDFRSVVDQGEYKSFKWCSPFEEFGSNATDSPIPGYVEGKPIGEVITTSSVLGASEPEFVSTFKNGTLPSDTGTSESCINGVSSIVELSDFVDTGLNEGSITIGTGSNSAQFILFEAVTGRAFLYDKDGKPVNYSYSSSVGLAYDGSKVLDIIIDRKRSSKFDVVTVYPLSGAVVHHVYSSKDIVSASVSKTENTFTFNGFKYKRYNISDELKSYRKK